MQQTGKSARVQRRPTLVQEEVQKKIDLGNAVRRFIVAYSNPQALSPFSNNGDLVQPSKSSKSGKSSKKGKNEALKNLEAIFNDIVRISVESHLFLEQWRDSSWTVAEVQSMVEIIALHELNALALDGKALWLLDMMLQYNTQPFNIKEYPELASLMIETLFILTFSQTTYNQSIAVLRLLLTERFGFTPSEIFAIGVELRLPTLIEDHNFIALLHFASECVELDAHSVHAATQLLLAMSGVLLCNAKSNYFLSRAATLWEEGLSLPRGALSLSLSLLRTEDSPPLGPLCLSERSLTTFGDAVALLRVIATRHAPNCEFVGNSPAIVARLLDTLIARERDTERDTEKEKDTKTERETEKVIDIERNALREQIATQCVLLLNTLSAGLPALRETLRQTLSLNALTQLAQRQTEREPAQSDALLELYLSLYEDSLAYCDESARYLVLRDTPHERLIGTLLSSLTQRLLSHCEALSAPHTVQQGTEEGLTTSSHNTLSQQRSLSSSFHASLSPSLAAELVALIDTLYAALHRLETALRVVSDLSLFLPEKTDILRAFSAILGGNPRHWDLRFIKMVDIVVLLGCGAGSMWAAPARHSVDEGFLSVSHRVVAQFVSLSHNTQHAPRGEGERQREKERVFFDAKDRNTLHYLAGSDALSTIPAIIARCVAATHSETETETETETHTDSHTHTQSTHTQTHTTVSVTETHTETKSLSHSESHTHTTERGRARERKSDDSLTLRGVERETERERDGESECSPSFSLSSSLSASPTRVHRVSSGSLSRTPRRERDRESAPHNDVSQSPSPSPSRTHTRTHSALSLTHAEEYLSHWARLLSSLLPHISFTQHIVCDWLVEAPLCNFRRVCFLHCINAFFGVSATVSLVQQHEKLLDLLWKILEEVRDLVDNGGNSIVSGGGRSAGAPGGADGAESGAGGAALLTIAGVDCEAFFALDLHGKCLQLMTALLSPSLSPCQQQQQALCGGVVSTPHTVRMTQRNSETERETERETELVSSFQEHVALGEWLVSRVLVQRPQALQRHCQRLCDRAAAAHAEKQKKKRVLREEESESLSVALSLSPTAEELFFAGRERESVWSDVRIRPSAFDDVAEREGEEGERESEDARFFAAVALTVREMRHPSTHRVSVGSASQPPLTTPSSASQLPLTTSVTHTTPSHNTTTTPTQQPQAAAAASRWAAHTPSLALHHVALHALLSLSHANRTVRRKLVATIAGVIDALHGLAPADMVNYKPLLYLVLSIAEFIPKLELSTEEAIVGLMIRCLTSSRLYIQSHVCDVMYCVGQESPGFVFRGLSRREIEDPLLQLLVAQREQVEGVGRRRERARERARERDRENRETSSETERAKTRVDTEKHSKRETKKDTQRDTGRDRYRDRDIERDRNGDRAPAEDEENDNLDEEAAPAPPATLLLNALKACTVLVHNFNVKPVWLPSRWLYHWQYYSPTVSSRELMSVRGLCTVLSVLQHAAVPFRLPCFLYSLSLTSSLMYAFSDGMLTPTSDEDAARLKELKAFLVTHTLPWLPIAIDFIMLGKKRSERKQRERERDLRGGANKERESDKKTHQDRNSPIGPLLGNSPIGARDTSSVHDTTLFHNATAATVGRERGERETAVPPCCAFLRVDFSRRAVSVDSAALRDYLRRLALSPSQSLSSSPSLFPSLSSSSAASKATHGKEREGAREKERAREKKKERDDDDDGECVFQTMYRLKAIETLTERTVDAIYAFLCTDDMFPLSTYLQHAHLFQSCSLVAAVAHFMTEFRDNALILRRGLDFLKYFAEYQMNVSSIAMHAPLALILAYSFHKDVQDVQLSFVKIVLVVVQSHDDLAKENLIRFNVHNVLVELIAKQHPELTRLAIQAMMELIFNENHALLVLELGGLVDALTAVLNTMSKDLKCQCEAVRALAAVDHCLPHLVSESAKRPALWPALRKTRKFLLEEQKRLPASVSREPKRIGAAERRRSAPYVGSNGITVPVAKKAANELSGEVMREDIDVLLNYDIWKKEKCTIC